ncbi:MAG: tail fiber domain-containing protein [Candidatus Pacebacteria bacterium]|nr:tail fiber domain-containing protein [Candidatus Paceibacterota bacterium]
MKGTFQRVTTSLFKENRLLVVTLAFLLTFSFATYVFATPPTSPYTPGETNDPTCSPGDDECYVVIAGTGTVTSFSADDLSPLFTVSVSDSTTTPALSFDLDNASSYTVFGNNTASSAEPTFFIPTLTSALFQNQGTTTTVLHGNAAGNPSWSQIVNADIANGTIDVSTKVTGTLSTDNGGTGLNSLGTSNQILGVNNDGNALEYKTISTNGTAVSNDVGVTLSGANAIAINLPSASATVRGVLTSTDWSTFNSKMTNTLTDGYIFVGNGSNVATAVALSGDATLTNAGEITIENNAVTTAKINNAAVTYAKFNNVAAESLVGNATGSSASATDIAIGGALRFSSSTLTSDAPTSIGAIDSAPSGKHANGLRIESNVLYAQNADATYPGLVSTGPQTFAGAKTFNGAITASGGLSAGSNVITGVGTPTNATEAANKSYVDGLVNGLKWKVSVNAATTTDLPLTPIYDPGASGVGAFLEGASNGALGAIDGVTLGASDRLLVKNETGGNEPYNGIYIVTTVGDGSTKYKLTRCTTCDEPAEFTNAAVAVLDGTVNAGTAWTQTNTVAAVGTDPVAWAQFLSNAYTEGTGIDITSGSISVDFSTVLGVLGVANGGTGLSSGTSGGVLYYSGAGTLASSGALTQHSLVLGGGTGGAPSTPLGLGTSGQCLQSQGAGVVPQWTSCGGAGTVTSIDIGAGLTGSSDPLISSGTILLDLTNANTWTGLQSFSITNTATSGSVFGLKIMPTYNQASGSAANTDLFINRTETAVGSGAQNLIDAQVGSTSKFKVSNTGLITATGGLTSAGTTTLSALSTGILHSNSSGVLSSSALNLAADVGSSILPVANGGTGLASGTSGGVLYYSGTGTLASSSALTQYSIVLGGGAGATPSTPLGLGTSGQCLISQGAGLVPQWTTCTGGGGVTSVNTVGSSPVAAGASISGTALTLQPANGTHAGVVSNTTQTFAGVKTFASDIQIHTGSDSITVGYGAGSSTTNTVLGVLAGRAHSGSSATYNTWIGYQSGYNATTGDYNTAVGTNAGLGITTGNYNVAIGEQTMNSGTVTGIENTAIGSAAGNVLAGGHYNLLLGAVAGGSIGPGTGLTSGSRNIILSTQNGSTYGGAALVSGSNNVLIGGWNSIGSSDSDRIVLSTGTGTLRMYSDSTGTNFGGDLSPNALFTVGSTSQFQVSSVGALSTSASVTFTGLGAGTTGTDSTVCITTAGVLTKTSAQCTGSAGRFKTNIETLTGNLDKVLALRPASYNYISNNKADIGFIAEEVLAIEPRLVAYTDDGQIYGLNYAQFAPLFAGAIQELDIKFETLSSIDVSKSGSLASLITNFLKEAVVEIKDATIGTLRVKNEVCVDDVCVTKDQFKTLLQNAGGSGTSGGGSGSTTTTGTGDGGGTTLEETGTTGEEEGTTTGTDSGTTTGEETETTGEDTGTTGGGTGIDTTDEGTTDGASTGEETGTTGESTTGTGTTDGGTTDGDTTTGEETGTTGESTTGTGTTDGGTTEGGTTTGVETGTTTGE